MAYALQESDPYRDDMFWVNEDLTKLVVEFLPYPWICCGLAVY
jgi:hypothetical protein